ncbi:hypothetical protein AAC387_Pa02g1573 [Persea americana]
MQRDCFTAVGLPEDGDLDCSARPQSPDSDSSSILSSGTGIVRPPCCLSYPMEVAARTAARRRAKQSSLVFFLRFHHPTTRNPAR